MSLINAKKMTGDTLDELFNLQTSNSFLLDVACENLQDGNKNSAYRYIIMHLTALFKHFLSFEKEYALFRFMRFPPSKTAYENSVIKAIRNKEIALASPTTFNDPMDPLIKVWLKNRKRQAKRDIDDKKMYELIQFILANHIRIGCFLDAKKSMRGSWFNRRSTPTIDDCHPMMWAHYAEGHTGICVQYHLSPKKLKVNDKRFEGMGIMDVNYQKRISLEDELSFLDSLTIKGNVWKDEAEKRLILFSTRQLDPKEEKYYCIKEVDIKAIYMGYSIDDNYRKALKEIASEQCFDLYQMCAAPNDITKLVPKKVEIRK